MPEVKLKVDLISHTKDPEATCLAAIRQCYSKTGALKLKEKTDTKTQKRLIDMVIQSGHTSTIEHASFTFAIEGISRVCSHQLVRHRIASFSQQSQRYVTAEKDFNYIIPPKIKNNPKAVTIFLDSIKQLQRTYSHLKNLKIESEDARFLLPNAAETKMVFTMNARELLHFFRLRLCHRAQWEIRNLALEMLRLVKSIAPNIFRQAGPSCETEKICWEGNLSCGKWKGIKGAELKERI